MDLHNFVFNTETLFQSGQTETTNFGRRRFTVLMGCVTGI